MAFDPNDYNEPKESNLSSQPDWYTLDAGDATPLTTVKAWARAMRAANAAHDAAEQGIQQEAA